MSKSTPAKMAHLFDGQFAGSRVVLTGHTGFKGSWMGTWLTAMGATVHGIALDPPPHQILFDRSGLADSLASDHRVDVRDSAAIRRIVQDVQPNYVFHLAAQPLVRLSYDEPLETFGVNVMGTAAVLDAVTRPNIDCSVVVVTTDKCYENCEWESSYRETDPMGGHDPYSASKGCAELVASSYRRSFASPTHPATRIATARAGNVIGGGDWAVDRIVPDVFRGLDRGDAVAIRNRTSTRPWQHVLEPISGYLWLAAAMHSGGTFRNQPRSNFTDAFNFGPPLSSNRTVAELVAELARHAAIKMIDDSDPAAPHEAGKLNLAIDRAFHRLGWKPVWNFEQTIAKTAEFYLAGHEQYATMMDDQIGVYIDDARQSSLPWSTPARPAYQNVA